VATNQVTSADLGDYSLGRYTNRKPAAIGNLNIVLGCGIEMDVSGQADTISGLGAPIGGRARAISGRHRSRGFLALDRLEQAPDDHDTAAADVARFDRAVRDKLIELRGAEVRNFDRFPDGARKPLPEWNGRTAHISFSRPSLADHSASNHEA
jgi:hypothetical protein